MTHITLTLTLEELQLLSSLTSDQLFRREFIDPRMPGYKVNPAELNLAKQLVQRLRVLSDETTKTTTTTTTTTTVKRRGGAAG